MPDDCWLDVETFYNFSNVVGDRSNAFAGEEFRDASAPRHRVGVIGPRHRDGLPTPGATPTAHTRTRRAALTLWWVEPPGRMPPPLAGPVDSSTCQPHLGSVG